MNAMVDTHLHVLDPASLTYPWLADEPQIDGPHLPSDVTSRRAPSFVVVEAGAAPGQGLDEARWVERLAAAGHPIAGIVAAAALERGAAVADELAALQLLPHVRGVRRLLQDEQPEFFAAPQLRAGLAALNRAGLTFDACIRWWQLPALVDLLRGVPGLPVVLDHLGKPPVTERLTDANGRAWRDGIAALAALPGTYVKLSGLPAEAVSADGGRRTLDPWLAAVVEAFGYERCMVGSDWPVSRDRPLGHSYDDWSEQVLDALAPSPGEAERLLHGTAVEFYRLDAVRADQ